MIDQYSKAKFYLKSFLAFLLFVFFSYLYWNHFELFAGLHGDEAWFGSRAFELIHSDYYKDNYLPLFGMTKYTSGIYSAIVAKMFLIFGTSIKSLRLFPTSLNYLYILLLTIYALRKYKSIDTLIILFIFLCSNSYALLETHISWEVVAFNPILTFLLLILIEKMRTNHLLNKSRNIPIINKYFFYLIIVFGTINHVIFSSIALAIALSTSLKVFINDNDEELKNELSLFKLSLSSCFLVTLIIGSYSHLNPDKIKNIFVIFVILLLPILGLYFEIIIQYLYFLLHLSIKKALCHLKIKTHLNKIIFFGIFVFLVFHLYVFSGVISNISLYKRFYSWDLSNAWDTFFYLYGAIPIIYLIKQAIKNKNESFYLDIFLCFILIYSIITNRPSIRYYLIPMVLLLLAYLPIINNFTNRKKLFVVLYLLPIFCINTYAVINHDQYRTNNPIDFRNFRKPDSSGHFYDLSELIVFLNEQKFCQFHHTTEEFITRPLRFYFQIGIYKNICSEENKNQFLEIDYCTKTKMNCELKFFTIKKRDRY